MVKWSPSQKNIRITQIEINRTIECGIEWNGWKDSKSITEMENTKTLNLILFNLYRVWYCYWKSSRHTVTVSLLFLHLPSIYFISFHFPLRFLRRLDKKQKHLVLKQNIKPDSSTFASFSCSMRQRMDQKCLLLISLLLCYVHFVLFYF